MKRWNGCGSDSIDYPVPSPAQAYLAEVIGPALPIPSANLEDVIRRIPASRLPGHPFVGFDPELRLRHSRGHSLPDWISLRYGTVNCFPDGVALPASEKDVEKIIAFAKDTDTLLIPYGGGTSVVGHINPPAGDRPVLTVSLERMWHMSGLDETSRIASFEAGVTGPHLEAHRSQHLWDLIFIDFMRGKTDIISGSANNPLPERQKYRPPNPR